MLRMQRCAPSGPQKYITKDSDGFHNNFTTLTMIELRIYHLVMLLIFFFCFLKLVMHDDDLNYGLFVS